MMMMIVMVMYDSYVDNDDNDAAIHENDDDDGDDHDDDDDADDGDDRERLAEEFDRTEDLLVDLGSDQTSCHNPYLGGYYPVQVKLYSLCYPPPLFFFDVLSQTSPWGILPCICETIPFS